MLTQISKSRAIFCGCIIAFGSGQNTQDLVRTTKYQFSHNTAHTFILSKNNVLLMMHLQCDKLDGNVTILIYKSWIVIKFKKKKKEKKKRHQTMTKANFEIGPPVLEKIFEEFLPCMGMAAILVM